MTELHEQPPEPVLEWVMLFENGRPASAVLRSNDMDVVLAWARQWPDTLLLHRRIVLEGNWIDAREAVGVHLVDRIERKRDLNRITA